MANWKKTQFSESLGWDPSSNSLVLFLVGGHHFLFSKGGLIFYFLAGISEGQVHQSAWSQKINLHISLYFYFWAQTALWWPAVLIYFLGPPMLGIVHSGARCPGIFRSGRGIADVSLGLLVISHLASTLHKRASDVDMMHNCRYCFWGGYRTVFGALSKHKKHYLHEWSTRVSTVPNIQYENNLIQSEADIQP